MPPPPKITEVVPTSLKNPVNWRYTIQQPADGWTKVDFDAGGWKEGPAGFGTVGGAHTRWTTDDIWIRRTFTMPEGDFKKLQFYVFHDEDVEIYVNGILAASEGGFTVSYGPLSISAAALAQFKPGAQITLATHCHQTAGGQNIDIGIANVEQP